MFKKCLFLVAISVSFSCSASQLGDRSPYQRSAATAAAALQHYELSLAAQVDRSIPKKLVGAEKRKAGIKASFENSDATERCNAGDSGVSSPVNTPPTTPMEKTVPLPLSGAFVAKRNAASRDEEVPVYHQIIGSLADVVPYVGAQGIDKDRVRAFSDLDRVLLAKESTNPRHYGWWTVASPTASPQSSPAKREKRIARALARAPFLEEGLQTQSTFEAIKQKVGAIFGLTARSAGFCRETFEALRKVGIEFSSIPELGDGPVILYEGVDPETGRDGSIVYYKGILSCGYSPKPRAVVELYKRLRTIAPSYPLPEKISFFDDQEYNIEDFMQFGWEGLEGPVPPSTRFVAQDIRSNLKELSLFHFPPREEANVSGAAAI